MLKELKDDSFHYKLLDLLSKGRKTRQEIIIHFDGMYTEVTVSRLLIRIRNEYKTIKVIGKSANSHLYSITNKCKIGGLVNE